MTISYSEFVSDSTDLIDRQSIGTSQSLKSSTRRGKIYRNFLKRAFDVSSIVIAAPIVVPVILALAACVRRDGSPAFYVQQRIGKDGRIFKLWKLRSMVADADARMEDYLDANPAARVEWDETQKLKNDPRITTFGQLLRRSSLDELPQLWNVLKGDMSLVGPRPMMPCQQHLYSGSAYYDLRPGITGHWQTAGRNDTTFEARAVYDSIYDEELSLATDIKILGRTVSVVMKGTGY